jgi:hypothetical protein
MELCLANPYPMKYDATWTNPRDGIEYEGSVMWANKNQWYFRGESTQRWLNKGIDISSSESKQVPKATAVGWAQRICGLTAIHPDVARASGIPSIREHYEGGLRRNKYKMRKSRRSNKSNKRKSRKMSRRR